MIEVNFLSVLWYVRPQIENLIVGLSPQTELVKLSRAILMTNVLRIAHLKIAHHVCNPEVGKREIHH